MEGAPADAFNAGYVMFLVLGAGFLLPWNAFITAVDYFDLLYPRSHVDRVFSVAYMLPAFAALLALLGGRAGGAPHVRINCGLALYLATMLVVPIMDTLSPRPSPASHSVTIAAVCTTGLADALVQGSLVASAGELPQRYMQALVAGTAASGVLVSCLRIVTKAALPPSPEGLRHSANLYFLCSSIFMLACLVCYNLVNTLPVIRYHVKSHRASLLPEEDGRQVQPEVQAGRRVWRRARGLLLSLALVYIVTLSIFPGSITEDVHSVALGDWYPVLLIASFNLFDLVGKGLTAFYLLREPQSMVLASLARLLFFPLFALCIHGPAAFTSEAPVFVLTSLLGVTNGYLTSAIMMTTPKLASAADAQTAGVMTVVFLMAGLVVGSVLGWTWVL